MWADWDRKVSQLLTPSGCQNPEQENQHNNLSVTTARELTVSRSRLHSLHRGQCPLSFVSGSPLYQSWSNSLHFVPPHSAVICCSHVSFTQQVKQSPTFLCATPNSILIWLSHWQNYIKLYPPSPLRKVSPLFSIFTDLSFWSSLT